MQGSLCLSADIYASIVAVLGYFAGAVVSFLGLRLSVVV
jgi:hypothetical protein